MLSTRILVVLASLWIDLLQNGVDRFPQILENIGIFHKTQKLLQRSGQALERGLFHKPEKAYGLTIAAEGWRSIKILSAKPTPQFPTSLVGNSVQHLIFEQWAPSGELRKNPRCATHGHIYISRYYMCPLTPKFQCGTLIRK